MPKQYCVGAVEKAIKILNFLAEHPDSSFSEIFTALELSKSTTYQTLSTLEMFHYVERLDNRQYRLAMGILPLLRGIPKQNDIVECVRGPLTKLADETQFSVHFCILDAGREREYIHPYHLGRPAFDAALLGCGEGFDGLAASGAVGTVSFPH